MDISGIDLENVYVFAERIMSLMQRRKDLQVYLRSKMESVAPNLAALIGDVVICVLYLISRLFLFSSNAIDYYI